MLYLLFLPLTHKHDIMKITGLFVLLATVTVSCSETTKKTDGVDIKELDQEYEKHKAELDEKLAKADKYLRWSEQFTPIGTPEALENARAYLDSSADIRQKAMEWDSLWFIDYNKKLEDALAKVKK